MTPHATSPPPKGAASATSPRWAAWTLVRRRGHRLQPVVHPLAHGEGAEAAQEGLLELLGHVDPPAEDREHRQDGEGHPHDRGRLVEVLGLFRAGAVGAVEGHDHEARHVERGEDRRGQGEDPVDRVERRERRVLRAAEGRRPAR